MKQIEKSEACYGSEQIEWFLRRNRARTRRRRGVILAVILLVLVGAVAVATLPAVKGGVRALLGYTLDNSATEITPPPTTPSPSASLEELLQEEMDKTSFTIQIYSKPQFESGTAEGALYILNDSENLYDLQVEITLDGSGESVYQSELLSPGEGVRQAALSQALAVGSYPATAVFTAYDRESGESAGTAEAGIVITILS